MKKSAVVPQDNSGANVPVLANNMIPVYYDESDNNWKKADITKKDATNPWYDYDQKKWANAVTVSATNRAKYLSAKAGTTIPMEDINTMWVWIPRYKYTYFLSADPAEISITFEENTDSTGTIVCDEFISSGSGASEECYDYTTADDRLAVGTSAYTHPAFTFGREELTGIWVGKFETSGDNASTIKPDVISTRNMDISTFFKYSRNMELANNIYGFPQSGNALNSITGEISGDSNNLDTHMMKNIEWGAVAYLSHSKYGKNSEVYINNSEGYYTGRSGGNVGGKTAIKDVYTDQTSMYEYNQYGFYTYDGYLLKYGTNEKSTTRSLNKVASTTGNIYGIYDMSGGTFESLMANIQDESDNFYPDSAATWSTADVPLDKYYDKYSCEESGNGDFSYGKLGDATIEMQPDADNDITWYDDYALFPAAGSHWFYRGANYDRGYDAGLFSVVGDIGAASDSIGARTVLSILP